jgi:hypothetical protein
MKRIASALTFILAFSLISSNPVSAASKEAKRYSSIFALKTEFVKAGGQCWEWKTNDPIFAWSTADCDKNTVLIFFPKQFNTMNEALKTAKLHRDLGVKVNLLVGPNWIINSDQVRLVRKKMGGTLITR